MPAKKSGLGGRGLDNLFGGKKSQLETIGKEEKQGEIAVSLLRPNPFQPRKDFNTDEMAELVASIKERGIIQPLIVRKVGEKYEIVAGERRYRAAEQLGLATVPAVIRSYDDGAMMEIALIENIQRTDLTAIEEAQGMRALMERLKLTQEEVAQKLGKSRPAVTNALRLLNLPETVQEMLRKGELTAGQVRPLLGLNDATQIEEIAQNALTQGWNSKVIAEVVKSYNEGKKIKVYRYKVRSLYENKEKRKRALADLKAKESSDIYAEHFKEELTTRLSTKVAIKQGAKGGSIVISFSTSKELERLYDLLLNVPRPIVTNAKGGFTV